MVTNDVLYWVFAENMRYFDGNKKKLEKIQKKIKSI